MTLRMRLPGGTLKFKSYRDLRTSERENAVPVWKIGSLYVIWSRNKKSHPPSPQKR